MNNNTYNRITLIIIVLLPAIAIFPNIFLSPGNIWVGEEHMISEDSIEFLYDLTYKDAQGNTIYEQEIFDKAFEMINNAEKFIVLDMFLFGVDGTEAYRNLTDELTNVLIKKKQENQNITIYFLTDYFSLIYNSYNGSHFTELTEEGIKIIYTSPNQATQKGKTNYLTNFLKRMKLRLNHRKLIIADNEQEIHSLITSANPHDPSSPNSNVAIYVKDKIWEDIYITEKKTGNFSDDSIEQSMKQVKDNEPGKIIVQYLTDGGMTDLLIEKIKEAQKGDSVSITTFALSNGKIIEEIVSASERGADIRIVLDQSIESFGKKKNGLPNKLVAKTLVENSNGKVKIRWYETSGEQFHTKMTIIKQGNTTTIFTGSSNLTPKRIFNYNLESDLKVVANNNTEISKDVNDYFNRIWLNKNGSYTTNYETYSIKPLINFTRLF
jgi:phosphatidylserine/phosphatidylglycerophosphate/cardiolipin synthase-like enzyme